METSVDRNQFFFFFFLLFFFFSHRVKDQLSFDSNLVSIEPNVVLIPTLLENTRVEMLITKTRFVFDKKKKEN